MEIVHLHKTSVDIAYTDANKRLTGETATSSSVNRLVKRLSSIFPAFSANSQRDYIGSQAGKLGRVLAAFTTVIDRERVARILNRADKPWVGAVEI